MRLQKGLHQHGALVGRGARELRLSVGGAAAVPLSGALVGGAGALGVLLAPNVAGFDHFDGVDRAGAHAQAAARALGFDHGKKVLGQPRDAAHGAGGVTQPTADAARRVNAGGGKGQLAAVFGVDVAGGLSRGSGELFNAGASAGGNS